MKKTVNFNKKAFRAGSFSIIVSVIALAIVIALNLLVAQLPESILRPDSTPTHLMTIGDETKDILKRLEVDIEITHYVDSSDGSASADTGYISGILERYAEASSHITVKTVDLINSNVMDETAGENTVKITSVNSDGSERRSKSVAADEMFMCEMSGYEGQYMTRSEYQQMYSYYAAYGQTLPSATEYFFAENEITGAIDYVMQETLPIVYCLTGHGETEIGDDGFGKIATDENVELKSLALQSGESVSVPEDAKCILINIPTADISAEEADALKAYIQGGGTVMLSTFVASYSAESMPNLAGLCKYMGLTAIEEQIIEGDDSHYYNYINYLLADITGNGITSELDSTNYYFYMPYGHAITTADMSTGEEETEDGEENNAPVVETYALLNTSDKAYVFRDEDGDGEPDEDAPRSQYTLAYQSVLMSDTGEAQGELIWFASPGAFDASYASGTGNAALFTKVLTKTCEKSTGVSLIGKEIKSSTVTVTESQMHTFVFVACGIIPVAIIAIGIVVWALRRRK